MTQRKQPERRKRGPVELATGRSIRALGDLAPGLEGLAASARVLAQTLDAGAGVATAAVARELRATLTHLTVAAAPKEDRDPFDEFAAGLAAEVGDGEDAWA